MAWQRSRVRVPLAPPGCRSRCHQVRSSCLQRVQRRPEFRPEAPPARSDHRTRDRDGDLPSPRAAMGTCSLRRNDADLRQPHMSHSRHPLTPDDIRHCLLTRHPSIPSQTAPAAPLLSPHSAFQHRNHERRGSGLHPSHRAEVGQPLRPVDDTPPVSTRSLYHQCLPSPVASGLAVRFANIER